MPVILNLIKESLKPVTLGAEGGHAIAPALLPFLALFLSSPILSFQNQLVPCFSYKTWLSKEAGFSTVHFSICPYFFESEETSPSVWKKDIIAFIMLTRHVHLWEPRETEYHYNTVNSFEYTVSANKNLAILNRAVHCLELNGYFFLHAMCFLLIGATHRPCKYCTNCCIKRNVATG